MSLIFIYLKYFKYLLKHKWYVMLACFKLGLYWRGIVHDLSKFQLCEFIPYAKYFYGKKDEKNTRGFVFAWLHHLHKNKHHWEYWAIAGDPPSIPGKYIKEMVCDWYGAGMSIAGKNDLEKWFQENKKNIKINKDNMDEVCEIMNILNDGGGKNAISK